MGASNAARSGSPHSSTATYDRQVDPDGRRKIDLTKLPVWARTVIALVTALAVGGLALFVAAPRTGPVVPASAIWRRPHRVRVRRLAIH